MDIGTTVYLRKVVSGDQTEFLRLMRASMDIHKPWISPPTTPQTYRNYMQRLRRSDHEGYAICRSSDDCIVGVININHIGSGQAIEQDLLIPERNIEIGSYHLAWLLKRYDNQRPLAIAAYNAGERRVDRWIKSAANTPMDVWIETIPFKETRNYVQNVLAFEVVYRGLDQRPLPILRNHEWVTPGG